MADKTIQIKANIAASLTGMDQVVQKLQQGLKEGTAKLDLNKGIGSSLSKNIASFQKDYAKIQKMLSGDTIKLGDSKDFLKTSQRMLSTFEELQRVVGNFETLTLFDAKKMFPDAFDQKVQSLKNSLESLSSSFDQISSKEIKRGKIQGEITALESEIQTLRTTAERETELRISSTNAQNALREANQKVDEIREKLRQDYKLKIDASIGKEKEIKGKIDKIEKDQQKRATTKDISDKDGRVIRYKGYSLAEWRRGSGNTSSQQRSGAIRVLSQYEDEKRQIRELKAELAKLESARKSMTATYSKMNTTNLASAADQLGQSTSEIDNVTNALKNQKEASDAAATAAENLAKAQQAASTIKSKESSLQAKQQELAAISAEIQKLNSQANFSGVQQAFQQLNESLKLAGKETINLDLTKEFLKSEGGVQKLAEALKKLESSDLSKLKQTLRDIGLNAETTGQQTGEVVTAMQQVKDSAIEMNYAQHDIDRLKYSILHFFSITNTIQVFRNTVKDALNTVKELDAVMTETAVVTDFTIGDMWEKLPEYAAQASELGTSIKDLYGATTLYYQQGLNSDAAMNVGIETMKMARIANMEASEATQAMTAALRGFNMEINEQSATRVNDVYSELAAITAADTNQIATAMTKTASIADAANMEFETTAALLAQIIETTQEAPETAGTAMKTIIARFTEVKELFSEGMLSGKDTEGEEININKIDAALKTVGISLKDFLNGTKGIDDIFLELASKWDTLDLATQRYIATTAAGSRQQSRFIAMMSNYDRTMELVNAANDSAGASQNQYEKTLESMEAKLQKLANAWDVFVMGLANNEALKFGIDALTKLLEIANKLTEALSGKSGLAKTVISFMTVMGAMKGGKTLLNAGSKFLFNQELFKTAVGKNGQSLGAQYFQTPMAAFSQAIKKGYNMPQLPSMQQIYEKQQGKSKPWVIKKPRIVIDEKAYQKALNKEFIEAQTNMEPGYQVKTRKEDFAEEVGGLSLGINEVSVAAMGAGAAINLLGQGMSAIGWEEAGELASDFGGTLSGLGGIAAMLGPLLSGLGLSAGPLAAIIISISALVALIPRIQEAAHAASPEGKLEAAQEATQKAGEAAEAAAASYESLKNAMDSLNSNYRTLNKMTKGTQKWKEASKDLNEEVLNLIDRYPELRDQFEYQNGVLVKKQGADAEISKILKQDEVDVQRAKQVETQRKIEESKAGLNVLSNYGLTATGGAVVKETKTATNAAVGEITTYQIEKEITNALADAIKAEEVKSYSEMQSWLDNNYTNKGYTLAATPEAFNKYLKYGDDRAVAEGKYDTQIANNLKDQAEILGQSSREFSEFDSGLMADIRDQIYKSKLAEWENEEITDIDKQSYADLMNYNFAYGKFYDKTSGAEITGITDDAIKVGLASAFADDATIDSISKALRVGGEQLSKILSEDGSRLSSAEIDKYSNLTNFVESGGKVADLNHLSDLTGISTNQLEGTARVLGLSVQGMIDTVVQNVTQAKDSLKKQRSEIGANMEKYRKFESQETNAQILANFEKFYGESFRNTFANIFESLESTGDDALIGQAYNEFLNVAFQGMLQDSKMEAEQLANFINNEIDWSNPIDAAYKLKQELKHGSEVTKQFAQNLLDSKSEFLGIGSQMQYLAQSADFEGIQEEIKGIVEAQGEVGAADILKLADSYGSLNKILKNVEGSAAGVAKALQAVAEGELGIHQLTDVVMASLAGFDGLESTIAEVNKKISEFDPGIDESFAGDFMSQASETVSSNVKKGAWGNSQNKKYLDFLLGPGWDEDVNGQVLKGRDYENRLTSISKQLERDARNGGTGVWTNLANGKDFYGNAIDKDALGGLEVGFDGKGGIKLENFEGMTTREIVSKLAEGYKVSEEYAEMMLTTFSNYSSDLMQELDKNDYTAGIKKAAESLNETDFVMTRQGHVLDRGTKKTADMSEIEAIAKLYGKDPKTVMADMGLHERDVTNFYDEEGKIKSAEDINDELNRVYNSQDSSQWENGGREAGKSWVDSFTQTVQKDGKNTKILNFDALTNQLENLNLPPETREALSNQILSSLAEGAENGVATVYNSFGEPIEVQLDAVTSVEEVKNQIKTSDVEAAAEIQAGVFAKAFGEIPITLTMGEYTELTTGLETLFQTTQPVQVTFAEDSPLQGEIETAVKNADGTVTITAGGLNAVTNAINNAIPDSKTISVDVGIVKQTIEFSGSATGVIKISAYAKGIKNSPYGTHPALVGEEGPELIQTKDGAYIAGLNGPEMTEINRGDTVYTADETDQILKGGKHAAFPRFEDGTPGSNSGQIQSRATMTVPSGGQLPGTATNADGSDKWENPIDKLYNLVREIDEKLRNRERLERRYEKLLQDLGVSAGTIVQYSLEELKNLEQERKLQENLISSRKGQIDAYQNENADLKEYVWVEKDENDENFLRIDWDKINTITDPKQGERVEEYLSQMEEWFDSLTEAEEALWEIEDAVQEIKERGKEEYKNLEEKVKDALIGERQREIDDMQSVFDTIEKANSELIDSIQKNIDKQRQERDNQRTEQDLSEKERRLAYLQQDTSNANQMEILRLQDEIKQGREDYTDTLIDQKISALQEQNEEAAKQRQQQIELAQAQLDFYITSGNIWSDVHKIMAQGMNSEKGLLSGSRLEEILKAEDGFEGMSLIGKMNWLEETNKLIAQGLSYIRTGRQIEDVGKIDESGNLTGYTAGDTVKFYSPEGKNGTYIEKTGRYQEDGTVITDDGKSYDDIYQGYDGMLISGNTGNAVKDYGPGVDTNFIDPNGVLRWGVIQEDGTIYGTLAGHDDWIRHWGPITGIDPSTNLPKVGEVIEDIWKQVFKDNYINNGKVLWKTKQYKTGGLADFTGPAWLDGTKSRPEIVLNQQDSQNFIQLRDILSSVLKNTGHRTSTENNGDITYDIDINVEKIGDDYSVEQVANKVKSLITENARYRNDNVVSLRR